MNLGEPGTVVSPGGPEQEQPEQTRELRDEGGEGEHEEDWLSGGCILGQGPGTLPEPSLSVPHPTLGRASEVAREGWPLGITKASTFPASRRLGVHLSGGFCFFLFHFAPFLSHAPLQLGPRPLACVGPWG